MGSGFHRLQKAKRARTVDVSELERTARTSAFHQYLEDVLVELCAIDTTPKADVREAADAESRVFDVIEREIAACCFRHGRAARVPIELRIADHPFFSFPYYTQTPETPGGLPVDLKPHDDVVDPQATIDAFLGKAQIETDRDLPFVGPALAVRLPAGQLAHIDS